MRHEDSTGPGAGLQKFDCARVLAAAFVYLAQAQGDPVGLHAITEGRVISVQPGERRQPFERIIHALENLKPAGRWPADGKELEAAVASRTVAIPSGSTREISIVLTDGYEHDTEIRRALAPLRARQHEVLLVHLLGGDELEFPFAGPVRFEEWETGRVFETDAAAARTTWLENQERHLEEWRRGVAAKSFEYVQFRTDEPLDCALRSYLVRRMKR